MSSNNRASLLAGLRTGGVRQSAAQMPQTSAPNVTSFSHFDMPMTAAVNGSFNPILPAQNQAQARAQAQQQQAFQMQMMQMEILRLQALQQAQQQYQIELIRQQQQTQQPVSNRQPLSAAPNITSFNQRRVSQAEQLKSQLHLNHRGGHEEFQAPMTASLGGKFGGRLNPNATSFRMGGFLEEDELQDSYKVSLSTASAPANIGNTAVISGGIALGTNNNGAAPAGTTNVSPSKSESSNNWRRTSNVSNNGNRAASVTVTVTPPPRDNSPPSGAQYKVHRPEPLRFQMRAGGIGTPLVIVDSSEGDFNDDMDDASSSSSAKSEPTTPPSNDVVPSLHTREEATKRLFAGLGMGRPIPQTAAVEGFGHRVISKDLRTQAPVTSVASTFPNAHPTTTLTHRASSQPMRQPLGPPSGVDELNSKNFASRIRRKAIGGLGAMLDARAYRREIEAF